jgi:hypothetical protein
MEPVPKRLAATSVPADLLEQYRQIVKADDRTISADLRRYIKGRVAEKASS